MTGKEVPARVEYRQLEANETAKREHTLMLRIIPSIKHSTKGPHKSQSLRVHVCQYGRVINNIHDMPQKIPVASAFRRVKHLHELRVYRQQVTRLQKFRSKC